MTTTVVFDEFYAQEPEIDMFGIVDRHLCDRYLCDQQPYDQPQNPRIWDGYYRAANYLYNYSWMKPVYHYLTRNA